MTSPPNDPLDTLLNALPRPPEMPSVSPEVWRQLCDHARAPKRKMWTSFLGGFESAFSQPSFAVAFVVACTLLGLFLAEMRVSRLHSERDVLLAQSYLKLIDPLLSGTAPVRPEAPAS